MGWEPFSNQKERSYGLGRRKGPIIKKAVEGPVTDQIPSTFCKKHPNALVVLDEACILPTDIASIRPGWSTVAVDDKLIRRAVVGLSTISNRAEAHQPRLT